MQIRCKLTTPAFLVFAFSILIYANSLKNGFVYDDYRTIVNNGFIEDFHNLLTVFNKDYFVFSGESSYRPGVTLTYFMDYALYGFKPWGYHLTNVLLHAINCILLYIFLVLLFQSDHQPPAIKSLPSTNALLCSLLFAAHPILTEAVNAISFREDLLVFFFYTATLNLYLFLRSGIDANRKPLSRWIIYSASCLLYFLALISKEMALTLPLIIFCFEWLYASKKQIFRSILLNNYNIGYAVVAIIYVYLRFSYFQNPVKVTFATWSLNERLITIPWLLLNYIKLMVYPVSLSADYAVNPVTSLFSPTFTIPFISLMFILVVAFFVRKNEHHITFGTFFSFATLIPVYNIIPISNPLAERYLYLPVAGFVIILGSFVNRLACPRYMKPVETRKLYLAITSLLILIYSIGVMNRNRVWQDDSSLWSDAINKMPASSRAHNNIGFVHFNRGRVTEAITEYKTALRLKPDFADAYNNLGFAYYKQRKFNEAQQYLLSAIQLNPTYLVAYMNLGMVYYELGRFDDSVLQFKMALRFNFKNHNAHNNLGVLYEKQGMVADAVAEYRIASRLKPDDPRYHFNLGSIYAKQRRIDEAVREFRTVIKLKPDFQPARQALEALNHNL